AATATFARASNTEAPPQPAARESGGHTAGMNWKTPAAPDTGFTALGLNPDSTWATQSACWTVPAPSGVKYRVIRSCTLCPGEGRGGIGLGAGLGEGGRARRLRSFTRACAVACSWFSRLLVSNCRARVESRADASCLRRALVASSPA